MQKRKKKEKVCKKSMNLSRGIPLGEEVPPSECHGIYSFIAFFSSFNLQLNANKRKRKKISGQEMPCRRSLSHVWHFFAHKISFFRAIEKNVPSSYVPKKSQLFAFHIEQSFVSFHDDAMALFFSSHILKQTFDVRLQQQHVKMPRQEDGKKERK